MYGYYSYKKEKFTCGGRCKWEGLGSDTIFIDGFEGCFEIGCPVCHHKVGVIPYPGEEEVLEKGSEEDKASVLRRRTFLKRLDESYLKSPSQLPDLDDKNMVFNTVETEENGDGYIAVTYKGKQIWKEMHGYEYYGRFIEMGRILAAKYGDRMIDLVPASGMMYGDAMSAPKLVEEFRASLTPNSKY